MPRCTSRELRRQGQPGKILIQKQGQKWCPVWKTLGRSDTEDLAGHPAQSGNIQLLDVRHPGRKLLSAHLHICILHLLLNPLCLQHCLQQQQRSKERHVLDWNNTQQLCQRSVLQPLKLQEEL